MAEQDEIVRRQFRNPEGEEGRAVLESMNDHHAPLWDFCLKGMPKSVDGAVLDVGCGGGGFIARLSERYPFAMFFGADISEESLSMTMETNADLYSSGGLELHKASVDGLPFDDGSFDLVTAMETYFFWPDLAAGLAEIARVVNPGGFVAIGSETRYGSGDDARVDELCDLYGMSIVSDDDMLSMMDAAGFDAEAIVGEHGVLYRGVRRF